MTATSGSVSAYLLDRPPPIRCPLSSPTKRQRPNYLITKSKDRTKVHVTDHTAFSSSEHLLRVLEWAWKRRDDSLKRRLSSIDHGTTHFTSIYFLFVYIYIYIYFSLLTLILSIFFIRHALVNKVVCVKEERRATLLAHWRATRRDSTHAEDDDSSAKRVWELKTRRLKDHTWSKRARTCETPPPQTNKTAKCVYRLMHLLAPTNE